jgi:hypothetical protein
VQEEDFMHRTTLKSAWVLAVVIVCVPAPALAQELRKDSVWNGVVGGAAIGAGLGVVVSRFDDICSAKDCALALAVAGGALGHLVDAAIGAPAPVVPGQWIDDSRWNGALVGAGAGMAAELIDRARHCGTGPNRVQCTAGNVLQTLVTAALFNAAIGAVVDVAIPTRALGPAGSTPAKSRRLALTFSIRF